MTMLIIVPCGRAKIWTKHPDLGPTRARDAYIGTPFKVNREYAERFADEWFVLSAKYGFLRPNDIIPGPYNVTFKDKRTGPIPLEHLVQQVEKEQLNRLEPVIGLGGKEYREVITQAFSPFQVGAHFPFAGMSLFRMLAAIKKAVATGIPEP
jgi:Family of unknown function (DUF6884)